MSNEISAPAPASNTSTKPGTRSQNTPAAGEAPAVSFLSLLGAMGLDAAQASATLATTPGIAGGDAAQLNEQRPDDAADLSALVPTPLSANWWGTTDPALSVRLPGLAGSSGQGPGAALSAAARAMESALQTAADAALSKPAAGLSATGELQQLSGHALSGQQEGDTMPLSSRDFMARVEAARTAAEPDAATLRAAQTLSSSAPTLSQVASMFDAGSAGLHAGGALRSQERIQPRMAAAGAAQGMVTWGDVTPAGTQHGASAVYAPGAMTPAPATAMAEKVHYWVSKGVQSAELQLEAFAGGSVDVSIAVKGDEAIIEFRTDQPQARQLLTDAMPELKELLAGEGLMLSGGFVGGSAQQGGQSQGRGEAQTPGREALVGAPQPAQGRAGAANGVAGSRVDLFV